ncbi:nucleoside deaminase [Bacillus badius]|uniref:nucleoside deaminase n=1 Tax=Bacillus badius TaxID=1455 RepID=UPI002E1B734C|nr:nucleoside deaminase [Bacillus badius]
MDSFMKRAVELAAENVKNGGQPFGAVLVKDSRIIAEGVNELHKKHDISAHAEMLAIRRAQEKLATNNLAGYAMYASGELALCASLPCTLPELQTLFIACLLKKPLMLDWQHPD